MDEVDYKIIEVLREGARTPLRKISKHLCPGKVILLNVHPFKY